MKSYDEFIRVVKIMENPDYDSTRFTCLLQGKLNNDGELVTSSKVSSITRFYESANDYNRAKITDLINTNIRNIDKVYKLVLDYENIKQQRDL